MGLGHSKPTVTSNEELVALRNEILHLSNELFNIQQDIDITTRDRLCSMGTRMTALPPSIQIPSRHPNGRKLTRLEKKQAALAAEVYRKGIVFETYRARVEAKSQMLSFKRDLAQSRDVALCLRRLLDQFDL